MHNIGLEIQNQFPPDLVAFIRQAGEIARSLDQKLYLVGGAVRDLLLGRENLDLDLVTEGDCVKLAEETARIKQGRLVVHRRFRTASVFWNQQRTDFTTSRKESYAQPGALPQVFPGDIYSDLTRRDFSINAMAACLDPLMFGDLIDPCHGVADLESKEVRILHDRSFIDDPTRIWRAIRYEQRLSFKIEPHTLELLQQHLHYLDKISGDRIRHELELCLKEECPEKIFERAGQLGILQKLNPALNADSRVMKTIEEARKLAHPRPFSADLYLIFLFFDLPITELEKLISYLKFPRATAQILQDALHLKGRLRELDDPEIKPSQIYRLLRPFSMDAILGNLAASDSPLIQERLELYLDEWSKTPPLLSAQTLISLGVTPGAQVSRILDLLRDRKLDGLIQSREEGTALVRQNLNQR